MEILTLGKISNQELASWFEITPKTYSNHRKKYLQKLQDYCEFTPCRGGIVITKIFQPYYTKNKNYQITEDNFNNYWSSTGLDTCTHVGSQIYQDFKEQLTVKEITVINHTRQVRNKKFNKPNSLIPGPEGYCYYILCTKDNNGTPVLLTTEQEKIKNQLLIKWFGTTEEKTVLIQTMLDNNEITPEEAWEAYSEMISLPQQYINFLQEFQELTGVWLIKGTQCCFATK